MSNKTKGKTAERNLRHIFEDNGCVTDFKPAIDQRRIRRKYNEDLFECFDFVAIGKDSVHFVQVKAEKTINNFYKGRKKIEEFLKDNNIESSYNPFIYYWCCVKIDRQGWRHEYYDGDEWLKVEEDELGKILEEDY